MNVPDLGKIPTDPDPPLERPTRFSSTNVPTGTFVSDKSVISSLSAKPESGEVLPKSSLRKFNGFLSFIVILLGLYIIITPLLPQIEFWLRDKSPESTAPYSGSLAASVGSSTTNPAPAENRIVIPSIGLNEPILESTNIGVITNGGTWRRPASATPLDNNNTVIVGHRYYGNNVSTFYNLDKVQVGQLLAVYWQGQEFLYEVSETKIVDPATVEIEAPITDRRLTLYTCTPIWTAKNRLVVIAKPVDLSAGDEETGR